MRGLSFLSHPLNPGKTTLMTMSTQIAHVRGMKLSKYKYKQVPRKPYLNMCCGLSLVDLARVYLYCKALINVF